MLVNNAVSPSVDTSSPSEASIDDMRALYEVNVFGPVRVTQAFLPFLQEVRARTHRHDEQRPRLDRRAVLTMRRPIYGVNLLGYNSSKSALNMITVSFAKELAPHGIKVNAANPDTSTRI